MDRLLKFFSSRNAFKICLVIAILTRSAMVYHYSKFTNFDEKVQLSSAINLIRGNGLTEVKYFSVAPDTPVYDHVQRWPPGYSLVITPFLLLFNNNEFLATTCLDIIMGILFILLVSYLCKTLSVPAGFTNIAILLSGCFQYYIFIQSFPSDHLALVSLLAATIAGIKIINHQTRLRFSNYLFISILFFLPYFFRHMYLPVSLLLPLLLILYSVISKSNILRINGIFLLLGSLLLSTGLLVWLKLYSGEYTYILETQKGIFPNQLLHWYPFMVSAFINIESATSYLSAITGKSYDSVMQLMELTNVFFIFVFLCAFVLLIRKNRFKKYAGNFQFFLIAGTILSAVIIFLLGYLTLTNKPQRFWNYNLDGRYFIFPVVFLQLLFIIKSSLEWSSVKNTFSKYLQRFLITLLLLEAVHGIFSTIKNITTHNAENPFPTKRYLNYRRMMTIFDDMNKKYAGRDVLVTSPNQFFLHAANNAGFKPIYDFETINYKQPAVTKKSVLVTVLNDDDSTYMLKYISEKKPEKFAYESFISFFVQEIDPLHIP